MKKAAVFSVAVLSIGAFAATGLCDVKKGGKINGAQEFQEHCASCHPKGGNIINPKKTLSRKDLHANGVKSAKDVVAKMRNPGPGMTKFDEKAIPPAEANAIAKYVIDTFK